MGFASAFPASKQFEHNRIPIAFVTSIRSYSNFQVAYRLADRKTIEREFAALEAIPDNYPKTLLTLDRVPTQRGGIVHRYLVVGGRSS